MHSTLNVCFMCLCINDNNCSTVDEQIMTRMVYILPEISIFKLGVPLYICLNCNASLELFSKFKEACLENSLSLEASIKEVQAQQNLTEDDPTSSTKNIEEIFIKQVKEDNENTSKDDDIDKPERKQILKNEKNNGSKETDDENDDDDFEPNNDSYESEPEPETETNEPMEQDGDFEDGEPIGIPSELIKQTYSNNRPIVKQQGYLCGICHQSFISVDDMDIKHHMLKDHSSVGKYKCTLCNDVFDREIYLYVHMQNKIHTTKPNLRCFICGKLFSKVNHLKTHLKLYIGIKEFQCFVCQIKFASKSNFERHMEFHRQAKIRCGVCNKWFDDMQQYILHEKIHKRKKRFSCYRCAKMFTMKHNMLKHIRNVHKKVKKYNCEKCYKMFTCKESLAAHGKWHENASKIQI